MGDEVTVRGAIRRARDGAADGRLLMWEVLTNRRDAVNPGDFSELETAERRLTETVLALTCIDLSGYPPTKADSDAAQAADDAGLLGRLERFMVATGGAQLALTYDSPADGWSVMLNFGREAPDSPMAGGSALGAAGTAAEALRQALDEARA